jgi:hypothetical protein
MTTFPLPEPVRFGGAVQDPAESPLPGGCWFSANQEQAGLEYTFAPGLLTRAQYLTADFLLSGDELAVFVVQFIEGETGPAMNFTFGLLNNCQARLRLPLESTDLKHWMFPREGALLKPLVWGQRVDLAKVDRLKLMLYRFSGRPVRWCMTSLLADTEFHAPLKTPLLTNGPLLDEFGQSAQRDWPEKTRGETELVARLEEQAAEAASLTWPEGFSRWGGWSGRTLPATGFFRTAFEDGRWWLVDPDGHPFWSTGLDCVGLNVDSACSGLESGLTWLPQEQGPYAKAHSNRPGQHAFDYLTANFIRAFGPEEFLDRWGDIALSLMRDWGLNTIANWSDWPVLRKAGFPYVRQMRDTFPRSQAVYRSFPDVFHADFTADVEEFAQQLAETADDPAFIGYFLMNEPTWGFSTETVAEGMLYTTQKCASRAVLASALRAKYLSDSRLSAAWGMPVTLAQVAEGTWTARFTPAALADLSEFSTHMVGRYFGMLNEACRKVDPNHLNLGARYYTVPPEWVVKGMRGFDVFSINCYREEVPAEELERIHKLLGLPTLIGEWHFGALDVGLPATGIGAVRDQAERGKAYRVYVEQAAAIPWCVGVHYFTLYDQSALGRFDGENYNIGFVDTCHRPYEALVDAARIANGKVYRIAAGEEAPTTDRPEYLPKVFL